MHKFTLQGKNKNTNCKHPLKQNQTGMTKRVVTQANQTGMTERVITQASQTEINNREIVKGITRNEIR